MVDSSQSARLLDFNRRQALALLFAAIIFSSILGAFAYTGYPPPRIDAQGLVPAAISEAAGRGFVDPVFQAAWRVDPVAARFVYHGPLYPLLLASLLTDPSAVAALRVIGFFNVVTLLLTAIFLYSIMLRGKCHTAWEPVVTSILCLGITTAFLSTYTGRPDAFAVFIVVACAVASLFLQRWRYDFVLWGIGLGLLAVSHPVAFLEITAALAIYLSVRYPFQNAIRRLIGSWLLAALVFVLVFTFIYPYRFSDWFQGMRETAKVATGGWAPRRFVPNWFFSADLPALGVVCFIALSAIVWDFRKNARNIASPKLFMLGCIALSALVFHFAVRVSDRIYNILPLIPLLFGGLIWVISSLPSSTLIPTRRRRFGHMLLFFVLLVCNIGLARHLALFPFYLRP